MAGRERDFVRWLALAARPQGDAVTLGIGDDMAALAVNGVLLATSDMLLDGTHFDSRRDDWVAIGRKAAGCGLSDCAAMAVRPVAATVSVAWPQGKDTADLRRMMEGIIAHCAEFECTVVGGDTTSWAHPVAIDVTVLAVPYPGLEPVRRCGARAGDGVFVTGTLGGSLLGKHLSFTPRVREALALATRLGKRLHALMDITDGLTIDLDRMIEASMVGAVLDETATCAAASAAAGQAATADGRTLLDHVLGDGEDFELLVVGDIAITEAPSLGLIHVGEIIADPGLHLRGRDGVIRPLAPEGYEHLG